MFPINKTDEILLSRSAQGHLSFKSRQYLYVSCNNFACTYHQACYSNPLPSGFCLGFHCYLGGQLWSGENIQNSHPVYTNCNEWPTRMIYFHPHEYPPTPFTLPSHTHMHTPPIVLPVPSVSAAAPSASSGRTPCMWHSKSQLSPHSRPSPRALGRDIGSAPAGRLAVHILGTMAPEEPSLGTGYRKADHGSCIRGRCSPDDPE